MPQTPKRPSWNPVAAERPTAMVFCSFLIDKAGGWQWWQCGSAQFKFQRLLDLGESADEAIACARKHANYDNTRDMNWLQHGYSMS